MIDIIENYTLLGYELAFQPFEDDSIKVTLVKPHGILFYSAFAYVYRVDFFEDNIAVTLQDLSHNIDIKITELNN